MTCRHGYIGTEGCLACVYTAGRKDGLEEAAKPCKGKTGVAAELAHRIRALKESYE